MSDHETHAVTKTADGYGRGTLRWAIAQGGRVTFEVGGLFTLYEEIRIQRPLQVLGGTAPVPVTIRNGWQTIGSPIVIESADVVLEHLRIRPGRGRPRCDGITVAAGSRRVRIRYCSISWALDEVVDVSPGPKGGVEPDDIEFSWCIISEPLRSDPLVEPRAGGAGAGMLVQGAGHVRVFACLLAHCNRRGVRFDPMGLCEQINTVVYNPTLPPCHITDRRAPIALANVVGNTFIAGSDTQRVYRGRRLGPIRLGRPLQAGYWLYIADNVGYDGEPVDLDPGLAKVRRLPYPIGPLPEGLMGAARAYDEVLARAGAWPRDPIDARIVRQVVERTGREIRSPDDVGGYVEQAN